MLEQIQQPIFAVVREPCLPAHLPCVNHFWWWN